MPGFSKPDTLAKVIEEKLGLMDYLGEDLYKVLESGKVKADIPFGFRSNIDLLNKELNIQKKFGKGYQFDLDVNRRSPMGYKDDFRIGITKKF